MSVREVCCCQSSSRASLMKPRSASEIVEDPLPWDLRVGREFRSGSSSVTCTALLASDRAEWAKCVCCVGYSGARMSKHSCTHIHTYIYIHVYICISEYTHTHIHVYTLYTPLCMRIYICTRLCCSVVCMLVHRAREGDPSGTCRAF